MRLVRSLVVVLALDCLGLAFGAGAAAAQTTDGTVYGHTGNFPGYVQFAAATADGSRAVTTMLNIPAPEGKLLPQLRRVQTAAVCDLLGE